MRLTEKQYNERLQAAITLSQDIGPGDSGHIDAHKALVDYMQLQPRIRTVTIRKNGADTWDYEDAWDTETMTDSDIDNILNNPDEPGTLLIYGDSNFGGDSFPTSAASCPVGSRFIGYLPGTYALSQIAEISRSVIPLQDKIYSLEETVNQLQSDVEALKNPE